MGRGRPFALFVLVVFGLASLSWAGLGRWWGSGGSLPLAIVAALQSSVLLHFLSLVRARLRPLPFRLLVTWPALWTLAGSLLALPWAIAAGLGFRPYGWWLPFVLAAMGLAESSGAMRSLVSIDLGGEEDAPPQGVDEAEPPPIQLRRLLPVGGDVLYRWRAGDRPHGPRDTADGGLHLVQISDPHLGAFVSPRRLRRACERAVAAEPDLIAITGDFLTMESQREGDALIEALAPLARLRGRVFACLGNHDLEALETVRSACEAAGVVLLVDAATTVSTPGGEVDVVGLGFHFRESRQRLRDLFDRLGPLLTAPRRIVLLHDPHAVRRLPIEARWPPTLVLSGHLHGGQLGTLRLGGSWTLLRLFSSQPLDHGLWGFGHGSATPHRLYVHRGLGHYGFPVRIGVPAEEASLRIRWPGTGR
ncbi:MAG: phosphodiesterase [Acidobacteria bacterium]|nr:MAG: phosphodiesterase [Acidobacteriota bacterium]REK11370.1 MAG: phosphodiesterase [Acidobacteriota bacterium]